MKPAQMMRKSSVSIVSSGGRLRSALRQRAVVQPPLDQRHQQHVQRRDREQAVGGIAISRWILNAASSVLGSGLRRGKHRRQQRGHRRHRQHQRLQAVEAVEEIAEPVDQHREPEDRRDRVADAEMQPVGRERGAREQRARAARAARARGSARSTLSIAAGAAGAAAAGGSPARAPEVERERAVEQRVREIR